MTDDLHEGGPAAPAPSTARRIETFRYRSAGREHEFHIYGTGSGMLLDIAPSLGGAVTMQTGGYGREKHSYTLEAKPAPVATLFHVQATQDGCPDPRARLLERMRKYAADHGLVPVV